MGKEEITMKTQVRAMLSKAHFWLWTEMKPGYWRHLESTGQLKKSQVSSSLTASLVHNKCLLLLWNCFGRIVLKYPGLSNSCKCLIKPSVSVFFFFLIFLLLSAFRHWFPLVNVIAFSVRLENMLPVYVSYIIIMFTFLCLISVMFSQVYLLLGMCQESFQCS